MFCTSLICPTSDTKARIKFRTSTTIMINLFVESSFMLNIVKGRYRQQRYPTIYGVCTLWIKLLHVI